MVQDSPSIDSLYDYLYLDKDRISSITAQLFPAGVLSSLKQTTTGSESDIQEIKGGIPMIGGKLQASEGYSRAQERLFDSSWSIPINLLDKLDELDMLKRTVKGTSLGQLVLTSGKIKIFDVKMVHDIMPMFKKMKEDELKESKGTAKKSEIKEEIRNANNGASLLSLLPFSTQIELKNGNGDLLWMSVKPEDLTIDTGNLMLKYGPYIPGEWHVVGFVDAQPDNISITPDMNEFSNSDIKSGADGMLNSIKSLLGRSEESYGITPIMIFRKVV